MDTSCLYEDRVHIQSPSTNSYGQQGLWTRPLKGIEWKALLKRTRSISRSMKK